MASWPTTLPQSLLIDGYTEVQMDGRVRTTLDAGPDFVRLRYSAVPTAYTGSLILTNSQVDTLKAFFNTTLFGGSDTFDWHPMGRHQESPQIILEMRFLSVPSYRSIGRGLWQVDISVESIP